MLLGGSRVWFPTYFQGSVAGDFCADRCGAYAGVKAVCFFGDGDADGGPDAFEFSLVDFGSADCVDVDFFDVYAKVEDLLD